MRPFAAALFSLCTLCFPPVQSSALLRALNRCLHRGLRHRAQRLARILLITAQLDPAHTVRARFDSERRNGRVRAERAAREMFPGRARVTQHGATAGRKQRRVRVK